MNRPTDVALNKVAFFLHHSHVVLFQFGPQCLQNLIVLCTC